jgi:glucan phosphoethanolaminetransferase (alkaline phosphatase superfamily)
MKKLSLNLLYEAALIFSLPVLFIGAYVWAYHNPVMAAFEHLYTISLLFLAAISLKILVYQLVSHKKIASIISANLYALILYTLIVYYALVFIGLQSWRRVITQEFIISYSQQARSFCEVLGISFELVIALLILAYVAIAIACYFFLKRNNWLPNQKLISATIFQLLLVVVFLFFCHKFQDYLLTGRPNSKEPVYMSWYSGRAKTSDHSMNQGVTTNNKLNMQESSSRNKYVSYQNAAKRNLIIIMVDALRPDQMGIYGYHRNTTPYLLKQEHLGLTKKFTNMRSTCGETTCAHASFFGSRYIHQFPDNLFTLQELLKRYDYTTNFIISGDHIHFNNIRDVYGKVDNYYDGSMQKKYFFNDDNLVLDKTKSLPNWDGKPAMFHYHLLASHPLGRRDSTFFKNLPYKNYAGKTQGNPEEKFTNFYDNGVLQTDSEIETLLNTLKSKKYLEDALVIITADHGESLGEHQLFSHTNSVQEELLRIPLILIPYGYASKLPKQYDGFMSLVDLAPTILQEFDMPIPETWVGKPIQQKLTPQYSFFQMQPRNGFYDLRDANNIWKYWVDEITLQEFAFNISKDPKEMQNLILSVSSKQRDTWRTVLPYVEFR